MSTGAKSIYADALVFNRREAGMYEVALELGSGLTRIGYVSGKAGNWLAETSAGQSLTRFNNRKDAGVVLAQMWAQSQRLSISGRLRAIADGESFSENALCAARSHPGLSDTELALIDRWLHGTQDGLADRLGLHDLAAKL